MNQGPITINASEVADCEYCEVSWSPSGEPWCGSSGKLSGKGSVAHSEYIRVEEAAA
ncbi:MAG: hypothetical protein K9L84_05175 [Candidatus Omnitrophica bacterium]|nr:hypothetical protein [Candidatus Omnitrophota bacterium]